MSANNCNTTIIGLTLVDETYTYDANGNLITLSLKVQVDIVTIYTYDANGNLISESSDYDSNGVDFVTNYTYWRISASYDFNNDRIIDAVGTYSYDFSGKLISQQIDNNRESMVYSKI